MVIGFGWHYKYNRIPAANIEYASKVRTTTVRSSTVHRPVYTLVNADFKFDRDQDMQTAVMTVVLSADLPEFVFTKM